MESAHFPAPNIAAAVNDPERRSRSDDCGTQPKPVIQRGRFLAIEHDPALLAFQLPMILSSVLLPDRWDRESQRFALIQLTDTSRSTTNGSADVDTACNVFDLELRHLVEPRKPSVGSRVRTDDSRAEEVQRSAPMNRRSASLSVSTEWKRRCIAFSRLTLPSSRRVLGPNLMAAGVVGPKRSPACFAHSRPLRRNRRQTFGPISPSAGIVGVLLGVCRCLFNSGKTRRIFG